MIAVFRPLVIVASQMLCKWYEAERADKTTKAECARVGFTDHDCPFAIPSFHCRRHVSCSVFILLNQRICAALCYPPKQDKKLKLSLNGNRKVMGTLRGYDAFLNIVLENATNETGEGSGDSMGTVVIRGNSIIQFESVDRVN